MPANQPNKPVALIRDSDIRRYLSYSLAVALALGTAWAVAQPLRSHIDWMNFEQDDFFYYLKVAMNVASGRGSTFNGIVPTNGYHPLWMWTLALVVRLSNGTQIIPFFLAGSVWIATMSTFLLGRLLLVRSGIEPLAAAALSIYTAVYAVHMFNYGMEVTLAIPSMLGLLVLLDQDAGSSGGEAGSSKGLAIGVMTTVMVLSRLDTMIFACIVAVGIAVQPELRHRMSRPFIAGIAGGLSPLAVYFVANRMIFGLWMPVSGMAKQMKLDHGFTMMAWQSFFGKSPIQLLNVVPVILALAALPWVWPRLKPIERAWVPATLCFPFIYIAVLSWLSDWQLWGWYFYMLRPALLVAFIPLLRITQLKRLFAWSPFLALLIFITLAHLRSLKIIQQQPDIVDAARQLQHFSLSHPGVYAMGDRSGAVAYLVSQPVVQTEGLMMDRTYLDLVSQQLPLRAVLKRYGVRYYVGSATRPYTGCFEASEPAQAGKHAPHLKAEFCEQPVAEWTFAGVKTLVFDLKRDH